MKTAEEIFSLLKEKFGSSVIEFNNDKLVEDFIVVDTKDVLLICKKEKEQEIKEYVAEVKRNMGDKFL